jgi:hypothetical protein
MTVIRWRVAGFAWLVFLLGILAYEVWALRAEAIPTLSAWVWRVDAARPWFRYAVLGSVAFLLYHFFWQRRR